MKVTIAFSLWPESPHVFVTSAHGENDEYGGDSPDWHLDAIDHARGDGADVREATVLISDEEIENLFGPPPTIPSASLTPVEG